IELTVAPVPGTEPLLFAGVVRDITERIRLEQQLRQAQKMQAVGQLAGGVAHDFNNQLTSVMGFAEMLALRLDNPEDRRFAEHILQASRRAADLTQKLLAFSRKGKFIAVPVDLHQIIVEVAALLRHSLDKRIDIRQEFNAPRAITRGDPNQLQNAFLNLAINARDAMPNGGTLTFATAETTVNTQAPALGIAPGAHLQIHVTDTGIGMDEETRKRLFEPFFTTKGEGKGTGLGLAAVYGTVKNHAGAITVETEFGHGTTFTVYLPLLSESAEKSAADSAAFTPTRPREVRVLVVDDEDSIRLLLVELLRQNGYLVLDFASGAEAVEYYRRFARDVDLVILDMVMPKMGGRETFAALKAINSNVKVLLASGYSLDGEAQSILNEGVLAFVQKPFSQSDLLQAVDGALKRRTP
ncbi:MAG TPA: ATP-binding protein, partial [Planctomycetota bacterium]|nr:ATP-binding protein [Planctomycetota bacterium]